MNRSHSFWHPHSEPALDAPVRFRVHVPGVLPGDAPIADYSGWGLYMGQSADGFMVRVYGCTKPENIGAVVFVFDVMEGEVA